MGTTAEKYAKALVEAGKEAGVLQALKTDFSSFVRLVGSNEDVRSIFMSKILLKDEGFRIISEIMGKDTQPLFTRFLSVLMKRGRQNEINSIHRLFQSYSDKEEGIKRVSVTTAFPLGRDQLRELELALSSKLKGKVSVASEVDGSLIGGGVVRVGDSVLDASVKQGLEQMQKELSKC